MMMINVFTYTLTSMLVRKDASILLYSHSNKNINHSIICRNATNLYEKTQRGMQAIDKGAIEALSVGCNKLRNSIYTNYRKRLIF